MSERFEIFSLLATGVLDWQLIVALGVVAVGGFLRGFTGFGAALMIVPVMSLLFTPREGVPMHAIMELPAIIQLLPTAVRHAHRPTVLPMLVVLVTGLPLGVWLLVSIDPEIMRIVISIVVLAMVGLLATRWRLRESAKLPFSLAAGAAGGIVQGSTGIGGPPIVASLMARGDAADVTRANIIALMGALIVFGLPVQWAYGLFTPRVLVVGALAAPVYLASIYTGSRLYAAHGQAVYRQVSLVMLGIIAVATLIAAVWR